MELTKLELEQILQEVTKEYEEVVKSERAQDLAKAEPPKMEVSKEESTTEASKPEVPKAEDSMPEGSATKEEPAMEAAPEEAVVEDVAAEPDGGAQMGGEDLLALYSALSPEHLAQHWMAASQALFQEMQAGEMPQEAAPEMMAPPPAMTQGQPPAATMVKAEETDEYKSLKKNFDSLQEQNSALEKSLETLSDKLNSVLKTPVKLGVTSETAMYKSEEPVKAISKSEIMQRLNEKGKQELSESDRRKLVSYAINPVVTTELKEFLGIK